MIVYQVHQRWFDDVDSFAIAFWVAVQVFKRSQRGNLNVVNVGAKRWSTLMSFHPVFCKELVKKTLGRGGRECTQGYKVLIWFNIIWWRPHSSIFLHKWDNAPVQANVRNFCRQTFPAVFGVNVEQRSKTLRCSEGILFVFCSTMTYTKTDLKFFHISKKEHDCKSSICMN